MAFWGWAFLRVWIDCNHDIATLFSVLLRATRIDCAGHEAARSRCQASETGYQAGAKSLLPLLCAVVVVVGSNPRLTVFAWAGAGGDWTSEADASLRGPLWAAGAADCADPAHPTGSGAAFALPQRSEYLSRTSRHGRGPSVVFAIDGKCIHLSACGALTVTSVSRLVVHPPHPPAQSVARYRSSTKMTPVCSTAGPVYGLCILLAFPHPDLVSAGSVGGGDPFWRQRHAVSLGGGHCGGAVALHSHRRRVSLRPQSARRPRCGDPFLLTALCCFFITASLSHGGFHIARLGCLRLQMLNRSRSWRTCGSCRCPPRAALVGAGRCCVAFGVGDLDVVLAVAFSSILVSRFRGVGFSILDLSTSSSSTSHCLPVSPGSNFGTGGMASKLTAAALSTSVGCNTCMAVLVCGGRRPALSRNLSHLPSKPPSTNTRNNSDCAWDRARADHSDHRRIGGRRDRLSCHRYDYLEEEREGTVFWRVSQG